MSSVHYSMNQERGKLENSMIRRRRIEKYTIAGESFLNDGVKGMHCILMNPVAK